MFRSRTLSQEFIETMLGDNGKVSKCSVDVKRQERERFAKVLADCRAKIDSDSKALVHKFEAKKKKLLGILNDFSETEAAAKLEELRAANVRTLARARTGRRWLTAAAWADAAQRGPAGAGAAAEGAGRPDHLELRADLQPARRHLHRHGPVRLLRQAARHRERLLQQGPPGIRPLAALGSCSVTLSSTLQFVHP